MFKEKPRYAVVLRKEPARDPGAACDILEGGLALASGNERFVRRWPRSVWIWSPELGRWQPRYGRPRRTVCVEVSTSDVRPSEAFDYWRDIAYYHFDADPQPPGGRLQFRARASALMTAVGDLVLYPNLAAKSLASLLNLSRATLYRAFHERGLTVAGYIREVRLQEAKRRLESSTPDMPVAAIAEACGFPDPNHFRRLFRERFGMSPSEVRDAPRPPYEQHSLHT